MVSVFLHLLLILPCVFAGTKLRYFREPSCNGNVLGEFSNDNSRADFDCHIPPRNITRAIFVDNIDTDCAIITFSDYACTPERTRRSFADKEMCFFSSKSGLLRSWRTVCGKEMVSLAAAWALYQKTHLPSGSSGTDAAGANLKTTTYTSITSWTTMNGTKPAVMYATVTRTGTMSVATSTSTSTSTGMARQGGTGGLAGLGLVVVVLGGVAAVL